MSTGQKHTLAEPAAPAAVAYAPPSVRPGGPGGLADQRDLDERGLLASLSGIVDTLDAVLQTQLSDAQRRQLQGARTSAATLHESVKTLLTTPREEAPPGRAPTPSAPQRKLLPATRSLDILVAEDNEMNQRVMVAVLESAGHNVTIVGTGQGALASLVERPFDVVLMDVQMPDMDGLEATRQLRANEHTAGVHTPVIALTARAEDGDLEACLAAGADGYVSKPFEIDTLLAAIDGAVRKRVQASSLRGVPQPRL